MWNFEEILKTHKKCNKIIVVTGVNKRGVSHQFGKQHFEVLYQHFNDAMWLGETSKKSPNTHKKQLEKIVWLTEHNTIDKIVENYQERLKISRNI